MPTVFVSIGSNIDRHRHIQNAVDALKKAFGEVTFSQVYEAEAIGFKGDPFYNLVATFETELSPYDVDQWFDQIEKNNGRQPSQKKFNARTLDLDLILYGDWISTDQRIKVPRADITDYAFVLEPLVELAPNLRHPVLKRTYAELWRAFDKTKAKQHPIPFSF